jgi:DNA-directed RNA polymerase I, II, and III subunit RPABC2
MSDDEYYSNSESDNDSETDENIISSKKKTLFKPVNTELDDSEIDEDVDEVDDEEIQEGGENSELEEVDNDEEDSDIELDEEGEPIKKNIHKTKDINVNKSKKTQLIIDNDDEDDDDYDENYLQKFHDEIIKNYVNDFHPECLNHNYDEIEKLSNIIKNVDGIIDDPLHRTIPYLTKYEKARVLGQRAKQIETGAKPLVKISENIIDSYIIAELELKEKKIPFIIKRPIPGGGCEYWNLKDLEIIAF